MVRDLTNLRRTVINFSEDGLNSRAEVKSKDEIYDLAISFNQMADKIKAQYDLIHDSYRQTITSLSKAIEANDIYTKGHCERVTQLSLNVGRAILLSDEQLMRLEYASILHDIGKIGIPSSILNKNGSLDDDEYRLVKMHPVIGQKIVGDIPYLSYCAVIINQHHERYDGKGYPNMIGKEDIVVEARILAITDAFDAMTSERPYRQKAYSAQEAIERLKAEAGRQFDPYLLDIFIRLFEV